MSTIKEKEIKENLETLFPGESVYQMIDLMKKMKKLIPLDCKDKIAYLEEIIVYVDGLLNGDSISQYCTYHGLSIYAKKAFQAIIQDVHQNILDSYRKEKMDLEVQIENLSHDKNSLTEELTVLQQNKIDLQDKNYKLTAELLKIKEELDPLKEKGMSEIHNEVDSEKKKLLEEISSLQIENENLTSSTTSLKDLMTTYNQTISSLIGGGDKNICRWEPVDKNHPIYNTNAETIDSFIASLKLTYQEKMEVSGEICEKEFQKNCPGLTEFVKVLKKFTNKIPACSSVENLIKSTGGWYKVGQYRVEQLSSILSLLKFPTYQLQSKQSIDCQSVKTDTIPTNVNAMLRELYFQRIAMEAVTKQKILEAELQSVVAILKNVVPPDFDFTPLLQMYGQMDNFLPHSLEDENSPKL